MCFDNDWCYSVELQRTDFRRARTTHRCEGCHPEIKAGDLCENYVGRFEGQFYSSYLCGACALDIYRIHLHEVYVEGCDWSDSWCQPCDLNEYCDDTDFERSTHAEGQRFMAWKREGQRLRKPPRKKKQAA